MVPTVGGWFSHGPVGGFLMDRWVVFSWTGGWFSHGPIHWSSHYKYTTYSCYVSVVRGSKSGFHYIWRSLAPSRKEGCWQKRISSRRLLNATTYILPLKRALSRTTCPDALTVHCTPPIRTTATQRIPKSSCYNIRRLLLWLATTKKGAPTPEHRA